MSATANPAVSYSSGVFGPLATRLLQTLPWESVASSDRDVLAEVLRFAARAEQEIVGRQMALATAESQALIDPQTGLENLRGFKMSFGRAAAAAGRYGIPSVLCVVAIDGLADIHHRHGRKGESLFVGGLADELRHNVRSADVVARTATSEFVILLTHCPAEVAASKAKQLASVISDYFMPFHGELLQVQAFGGSAAFSADVTLERLLSIAHHDLATRCASYAPLHDVA